MLTFMEQHHLHLTGGSYEYCVLDSMTVRTPEAYQTEILLPVEE